MQDFNDEQRRALCGARSPYWEVFLLDSNDTLIKQLNILDGSVELAPYERLGGSASVIIADIEGINFLKHRVQIIYHVGISSIEPWSVGVYLFASPKESTDEYGRVIYEVGLLPKLTILDSTELSEPISINAGDNLVEKAAELVSSVDNSVVYTPSSLTARESMLFPVGENLLTVINKILSAANYWSVQITGAGSFSLQPYQDPSDRSSVWSFMPGDESIISPVVNFEQDIASVPNQVVCYTSGTDSEPALVAIATNTDSKSPYSVINRGRVISKSYEVDAANQSTIQSLANRYLANATSPVATYSVVHGIIPGLQGHDAVTIFYKGNTIKATVQRTSMKLTFDSQAETTLRQS